MAFNILLRVTFILNKIYINIIILNNTFREERILYSKENENNNNHDPFYRQTNKILSRHRLVKIN